MLHMWKTCIRWPFVIMWLWPRRGFHGKPLLRLDLCRKTRGANSVNTIVKLNKKIGLSLEGVWSFFNITSIKGFIYLVCYISCMSELNKYGIGFWIGGGVYSIINMIMNYKRAAQGNILFYNYLITGVAVIGLILNIILLKRTKKWWEGTKDILSGLLVSGQELVLWA